MNVSNISYDRFTRKELLVRHERAGKHNKLIGIDPISFEDFIIKFYPSYAVELGINLPAPVLAEPSKETKRESVNSEPATPISATAVIDTTDEARESTNPIGRLKTESDSRGGQKPFDKKTYQRNYMRKKRAK